MRFEKFVNIVPVKADVLIGFIDDKIILPLYIFKNKEVMIHSRLDISNEIKSIKTLYKAGFINGDLELTQEGKEVNEAINFSKNKTELVKAAEEKIKEEEKSK